MGIEIVKAVAGNPSTSRLSGNAYKVLVAMALHSLDKPKDGRPAGLYFAGWAPLQLALGYEAGGVDSAAHTAVKRAVRELKNGNHITPMVVAARGTRQSYLVHPGGIGKGVTSDPQPEEERGSPSDPKRGSPSDPNGGRPATHLGHIEEGRGLTKDEIPTAAASTTDRSCDEEEQPKGHRFRGNPGDDCGQCGMGYANRRVHPIHLAARAGGVA